MHETTQSGNFGKAEDNIKYAYTVCDALVEKGRVCELVCTTQCEVICQIRAIVIDKAVSYTHLTLPTKA